MIANIHEAKTQFSRLVDLAVAGEEIIIAKAGTPVARLVPYVPAPRERRFGLYADQIDIGPDFDDDLGLAELFERGDAGAPEPGGE